MKMESGQTFQSSAAPHAIRAPKILMPIRYRHTEVATVLKMLMASKKRTAFSEYNPKVRYATATSAE